MKSILKFILGTILVLSYACSGQKEQITNVIDNQVDSISSISKDLEQKVFQNPESSEILTGFYDKNSKPVMLRFDSYPDFVQFYYADGIVCIIHNIIGEGGVQGSESKYYYKEGKLFHYTNNNEVREINADIEKASKELLGIEAESLKNLKKNGKSDGESLTQNTSGSLDFLNDFVDKPSYDVSEDERLTSRLKAIVTGEGAFGNLIAQLAYGDAIQKFNDAIIINGQARQVIDEEGNQVTFVSIIVADLKNNVLSIGMTDEDGNTSIFYTEAPGQKYPKQLADWFTKEYKVSFKIVAQD